MKQAGLQEDFDGQRPDARLAWFGPPARWSLHDSRLIICPATQTDYWQRTHYGFSADNGHFLGLPLTGDFLMSTRVRSRPAHQYDQAGLMVRYSPDCWLKTSVEFEPDGPSRLGAVVTAAGYSDWSTQDFELSPDAVELRIRKRGEDFTVDYRRSPTAEATGTGDRWSQIRIAHLASPGSSPLYAGVYACSPKGAGFEARFDYLRIECS
ncbi:MAG: DUF1349 domain-containing protein [Limisphaerales bacterium]